MKKLTKEKAFDILTDVVKNKLRHRDYDRVTEYADKLRRIITGEDMTPLMRRFDKRESEAQFQQRVRITQHITGTVARNLMKPAHKIPRSNGIQRILKYANDEESKKLHEFNRVLRKFWGDKSLDQYLSDWWIELVYSDPNSFVVYEWGDFDSKKERAQPYPFEVSSHEAIYYQFENNILQYLVVLNEFEQGAGGIPEKVRLDNDNKNITKRYTMYFPGGSIVLDQLSKEEEDLLRPQPIEDKYSFGDEYINIRGGIYRLHDYDSRLDFIPAIRVGFEYDLMTRRRTCVSPLHGALPILMKTIKANSELDLTMSLHAHPQKIQYVAECQAPDCNRGRLPDGGECPACNGTGKMAATSAQEEISLRMPRDKEDLVALDNIIRYEYPPVDLVKFQHDYIRSLTEQCVEAMYNSEVFTRKQIAETATKNNIDLQNVYDALYKFAQNFANMWEFSIKAISDITDMDEGLIYAYIINKDFKMKSLNDLYNDLKLVSDSRADAFIKQGIQDDIARIIYTDDEISYMKYKTKEEFYPYSGKSAEQVAMIVASVPQTDFNRVLWECYGWIFGEIEREYLKKGINFYELARSRQWSIVKRHVDRIIKERESQPMPTVKEDGY